MRKLIAWVFMYSLDGLLADEGTEYWQFCSGLPNDPAETKQKIGLYQSAYAHLMGRAAYEGMAGALPTADHPVLRHHERRAQGRLLPDPEDG
jgi:dihydrofolate reductase